VLYRVRLRTAAQVDWRRTTRLAYGSLLALSHDGFESITWATVASREPSLLVGDTPSVDISFPEVRHLATSKTLAQHRHAAPDPSRDPASHIYRCSTATSSLRRRAASASSSPRARPTSTRLATSYMR